jgi:hypothetical protein
MFDRNFGPTSCEAMQETGPVMPSGAAPGVGSPIDDTADLLQRMQVLSVSSERVFDLGLFEHGIHTAQPVRPGVGHRIESAQRVIEIS